MREQLLEERAALMKRVEAIDTALEALNQVYPDEKIKLPKSPTVRRRTGDMSMWRLAAAFVEERGSEGATKSEVQNYIAEQRGHEVKWMSLTAAMHRAKAADMIFEDGDRWYPVVRKPAKRRGR